MSEIITGRAVVWSVGSLTMTGEILSGTNPHFLQSLRFSRTGNKTDIMDDGGTVRAQVFSSRKKTLSITVIPCDVPTTGTKAGARASMEEYCPELGSQVTIVDSFGALLDASFNVVGVTQNRSVDGVATIDLELETSDEGVDFTGIIS